MITNRADSVMIMSTDMILEDTVSEENRILQTVIDNLRKPQFATISEDIVVDYIFEYSKKLLSYAMTKHGSKEMAYAINLNTLDFIGAEFGTSKSVNIASLVDRIDDSECIFIVLHNHPSDGPFSARDLNTFFITPNMAVLMVIGNKGSIYTIEKTERELINDNYMEIKKALIAYRQKEVPFDETVKELEKYGIIYRSL